MSALRLLSRAENAVLGRERRNAGRPRPLAPTLSDTDTSTLSQAAPQPRVPAVADPAAPAAPDMPHAMAPTATEAQAGGPDGHNVAAAPPPSLAVPAAESGASPFWGETLCSLLVEHAPGPLSQTQCEAFYVNGLSAVAYTAVPALLLALAARLWWRVRAKPRPAAGAEPRPLSDALAPETASRLRDLLCALPRWHDTQARRGFVTLALGKGSPLPNEIV